VHGLGTPGKSLMSLLPELIPELQVSKYAMGLAFGGAVLQSSMYTVDGGERAVLFDRLEGVKQTTSGEGTHFL